MLRKKSPEAGSPFQEQGQPDAEQLKKKPIAYFTETRVDSKTGEKYEQRVLRLYLQTKEEEKAGREVVPIELDVYSPEREGGVGTNFDASEFRDFILDDAGKELLRMYAVSAKLDHIAFVEGVTDVGKTKTLEYLAYLTNHKLVRVSVKGSTDPSEFFGKHVPGSETAQKKIRAALAQRSGISKKAKSLIVAAEKEGRSLTAQDIETLSVDQANNLVGLSKASRELFKKAAKEGRGLTVAEWEELSANEGIDLEEKMFKWQDGEVVKAMIGNNGKGYWIYLDEVSAAEPQILIALNRVMEQRHRIELSEDGGRYVDGGDQFRMFASTNPPEYSGRVPMAPDFLRRGSYLKTGSLNLSVINERFSFVTRGLYSEDAKEETQFPEVGHRETRESLKLEKELVLLINQILPPFFETLRSSQVDLAKKQKQKFSYEFSDLIRVRDFIKAFGYDDPLTALRQSIEYTFLNKIGDETARSSVRKDFETYIKNKGVPEKIKEVLAARKPSKQINKIATELDDAMAGF